MAFQTPAPFSFGASSAAAPFGASTPAFGSSTPAFSFSSTPAPLFGRSTPAFGSSTPGFGSSTPGFGTSTPAFSFSSAAPSNIFGASTPAFGAAASTPLFSFSSAASPATGSIFSFQPSQPAQSPAQPFQQHGGQNMQMTSFGVPAQPDLDAIRELEALRQAFQAAPGNRHFRFQHLFLNVVDHPAARVRPQDVDDLQWRETLQAAGGANNKAKLWPVAANGFQDLVSRKQEQDKANDEHKKRLEQALQAAQQLLRRQDVLVHDQLTSVQRKHGELCHRMLRVMRSVDGLEGRFAAAVGHHPPETSATEARLADQLSKLEASTAASSHGVSLKKRVDAVASAANMQAQTPAISASGSSGLQIDAASYEQLFSLLEQHSKALQRLQKVVQRCNRDISIMAEGDQ